MAGEYVFWEDFAIGDTAEFGSYTVTREEIIEFATKYDPQPFHLSDEAAEAMHFGALCASGWHTCSMFMAMMVKEIGDRKGGLGSPGMDNLRWKLPVFVDDVLTCKTEVIEKSLNPKRPYMGFVKLKNEVFNQEGAVVLTMTANIMQMRAPQ